MKTEILKINEPNISYRVYSFEVVKKAIEDISFRFGTVSSNDPNVYTNIDKVSHKATNFKIEGNTLVCDIEVLDTPMGNILQDLIDQDVAIRFYTTGSGEVNKKDSRWIVSNYSLIAVNWEVKKD